MALRIRRGTNAQRTSVAPFDMGEIVWTTDTERLYVGDGITSGGKNILANSAGVGLVFNAVTQRLDVGDFTLTTDDVTEGTLPGRQYFTVERAQSAAASLFTTGAHNGISFTYQDANNRIDASVSLSLDSLTDVVVTGTPTTGYVLKFNGTNWVPAPDVDTDDVGIKNLVEDLTPELGGNLTLNGFNIVGLGTINHTGNINLVGDGITTGNITAPGDIEINGTLSTIEGLGDDLSLNGNDIIGTGNINIVGDINSNILQAREDLIVGIVGEFDNRTTISPGLLCQYGALDLNVLLTEGSINVRGVTSTPAFAKGPFIKLTQSRGTLDSPAAIQSGDWIGGLEGRAWNGSLYALSGYITFVQDSTIPINPSSFFMPSKVLIGVSSSTGITASKSLTVDSEGVASASVIQTGVYLTNPTDLRPANPAKGMIIFNDTSGQFEGWNGTSWVAMSPAPAP